jgi:hypothetical protein
MNDPREGYEDDDLFEDDIEDDDYFEYDIYYDPYSGRHEVWGQE